jgi:fatty-acid desaturase
LRRKFCHWLAIAGKVAERAQRWQDEGKTVSFLAVDGAVQGLLAFGEGWHNNHHAFPHSARHGFGSQIDLTWLHIKLMRRLGLATHVRLPRTAARG